MKIALDSACLSSSMTGVGRYFHCLDSVRPHQRNCPIFQR